MSTTTVELHLEPAWQVTDVRSPIPLERVGVVYGGGCPSVGSGRVIRMCAAVTGYPKNQCVGRMGAFQRFEAREPPPGTEGRRVAPHNNELARGGGPLLVTLAVIDIPDGHRISLEISGVRDGIVSEHD